MDSRSKFKGIRYVSNVSLAQLSSDAMFIEIFLEADFIILFLDCLFLLFDQVDVALYLLAKLSICYFQVLSVHIVLLFLKFGLLELVLCQGSLFLNVLVHLALVKHVDAVLLM